MKLKILAVSLPLFLVVTTFCMEQEEGEQPEKSAAEQQQLEQREEIRREHAAEYRRELEAKKEAARQEHKKAKTKEPVVEPGKGKEEEKPLPLKLTKKKQEEILAEVKEAFEKEREKLKQVEDEKKKETATGPQPPASFLQFLKDNQDKLIESNIDETFIKQIVAWINNRKIIIGEEIFSILLYSRDRRIRYAVLRDPGIDSKKLIISTDFLIGSLFSDELLFTPFALSQGKVLMQYLPRVWPQDIYDALIKAGLLGSNMELETKILTQHSRQGTDISYLARTKNVDLLRIILFLALYSEKHRDKDRPLIMELLAKTTPLTGNETMPNGTTALMYAVGGGYLEIVRELLLNGANPFQANIYGDDAFSIAEIQVHRALLHNNKTYYGIYKKIANLLDEYTRQRAKDIARELFILTLSRVVENPDGTKTRIPGFPLEIALHIAIGRINEPGRLRILRDLERLTRQELAAIYAEVVQSEGPIPTPTLLERFSSYLPAAALSYYFTRGSNP